MSTDDKKPPVLSDLDEANQVIAALWQEIQDLKDRLNQNSGNSSKPPSSDGPGAIPRKRKPSGRKRGAQPGHNGSRRQLHQQVDQTVTYYPPAQCSCGSDIHMSETPFRRHQVFDLPEMAYTVTEHQLYQGCCPRCGKRHQATLPGTVSDTQMGSNLLAYIAVQAGQFHQSIDKIRLQLSQNFGLAFSRGAISEAQWRMTSMLTPAHQAIKQYLRQVPVRFADETRHQRGSERRWMWVMSCPEAACFMTDASRGQQAAKRLLGDTPEGITVSDQYVGYHFIDPSKRQLCWAHLLRNINALAESSGPDRRIGRKLLLCIDLVFRTRQRFEDGALTRSRYLRRMHRVRQRWHQLLEQASRECLIKRYRNRCARLLRESPQCWTFLEHDGVPLTNNEAERVLRGYVLWRKGSYGVCSHRGEQFRQRVLSLVETARKLKLNPLAWAREIALACIEKTPYPIPDALIF